MKKVQLEKKLGILLEEKKRDKILIAQQRTAQYQRECLIEDYQAKLDNHKSLYERVIAKIVDLGNLPNRFPKTIKKKNKILYKLILDNIGLEKIYRVEHDDGYNGLKKLRLQYLTEKKAQSLKEKRTRIISKLESYNISEQEITDLEEKYGYNGLRIRELQYINEIRNKEGKPPIPFYKTPTP